MGGLRLARFRDASGNAHSRPVFLHGAHGYTRSHFTFRRLQTAQEGVVLSLFALVAVSLGGILEEFRVDRCVTGS